MCSSYLITMLVTEPASSFYASLRVLHLDGFSVGTHVCVHGSVTLKPAPRQFAESPEIIYPAFSE